MNPSSAERPSQLPASPASAEQLPTYGLPEARTQAPEVARNPISPENSQPGGASLAAYSLPPALALPVDNTTPTTSGVAASTVVPDTADDSDLIEKEWVLRAKQVITDHQDDPYEQTKQLNVVKAEYMKKRYNKTVKLT